MSVCSKHLKLIGAAGAGALVLSTVATAPAIAASQSFTYTCPVFAAAGDGEDAVSVDLDPGTIPATMVAGQTRTNSGAHMTVHLDPFQTGLAATFGSSVSGKVVATGVHKSFPFTMTIPATPIPSTPGDTMDVPASGPVKIRPLAAGTWTVKAGDMTATLTVTGGVAGPQTIPVDCTAPTDSTARFGTIQVSKDKTTTAATAAYSARKDIATGKAKVKSHFGLKPTGKVTFTLKKGRTKIGAIKGTVNKKGIALVHFKNVKKRGQYSITAKYGGNANLKSSSDSASFTVS